MLKPGSLWIGHAAECVGQKKERYHRLTPREFEILMLFAQGNCHKEIGAKLGISHRTAGIHRTSILKKLKARSTLHAVAITMADAITILTGTRQFNLPSILKSHKF